MQQLETLSKLVEDLRNKIIGSLKILATKKGLYLGSNSVCHSINFDDVRMSSEKQQHFQAVVYLVAAKAP